MFASEMRRTGFGVVPTGSDTVTGGTQSPLDVRQILGSLQCFEINCSLDVATAALIWGQPPAFSNINQRRLWIDRVYSTVAGTCGFSIRSYGLQSGEPLLISPLRDLTAAV
jgi:hypothetical protein